MISTIGSPAASIRFPRQQTLLFNTRVLPITRPVTPIFIRTALGLRAEDTAMAGGPSVRALVGPRSPWANGCGIPVSAGHLLAINRGVGLLITTVVGCLTPLAADGSILHHLTSA